MRGSRRHETAVEKAAEAVRAERAKLEQWTAEEAAARAALASLQGHTGEEVLDNPDAAANLARAMQEQRDRIDIAGRAIEAQRGRVGAAETAYLHAEARVLEEPVKRLQAKLDEHNGRTAELLKMLEEHEGRFVPENDFFQEEWRRDGSIQRGEVRQLTIPASEILADELARARRPLLVLQELAGGRDPGSHPDLLGLAPADYYPACVWGPDALVPAPAYVRQIEVQTSKLQSLRESQIPAARERIATLEAEMEEAEANGDSSQLQPGPTWPGLAGKTLTDKLNAAKGKLAKLLAEESRLAGDSTTEQTGDDTEAMAVAGSGG